MIEMVCEVCVLRSLLMLANGVVGVVVKEMLDVNLLIS